MRDEFEEQLRSAGQRFGTSASVPIGGAVAAQKLAEKRINRRRAATAMCSILAVVGLFAASGWLAGTRDQGVEIDSEIAAEILPDLTVEPEATAPPSAPIDDVETPALDGAAPEVDETAVPESIVFATTPTSKPTSTPPPPSPQSTTGQTTPALPTATRPAATSAPAVEAASQPDPTAIPLDGPAGGEPDGQSTAQPTAQPATVAPQPTATSVPSPTPVPSVAALVEATPVPTKIPATSVLPVTPKVTATPTATATPDPASPQLVPTAPTESQGPPPADAMACFPNDTGAPTASCASLTPAERECSGAAPGCQVVRRFDCTSNADHLPWYAARDTVRDADTDPDVCVAIWE